MPAIYEQAGTLFHKYHNAAHLFRVFQHIFFSGPVKGYGKRSDDARYVRQTNDCLRSRENPAWRRPKGAVVPW